MNRYVTRVASVLAISILPANAAQAACWSSNAASAATVQTMGTMLMVGALRCRAGQDNFLPDYGRFVEKNNSLLSNANITLKGHFANAGGINAHDRYVTSIANRFGGGQAGLGCGEMKKLASAASKGVVSMAYLANLAEEANVAPVLPGGRCVVTASGQR